MVYNCAMSEYETPLHEVAALFREADIRIKIPVRAYVVNAPEGGKLVAVREKPVANKGRANKESRAAWRAKRREDDLDDEGAESIKEMLRWGAAPVDYPKGENVAIPLRRSRRGTDYGLAFFRVDGSWKRECEGVIPPLDFSMDVEEQFAMWSQRRRAVLRPRSVEVVARKTRKIRPKNKKLDKGGKNP